MILVKKIATFILLAMAAMQDKSKYLGAQPFRTDMVTHRK